jgi:putative OmpL-like beta-barrel porin-2
MRKESEVERRTIEIRRILMNKSECLLLKYAMVQLLFTGFFVLGFFAMSAGLVFGGESESEEVVEPGKVGRLEEVVENEVLEPGKVGRLEKMVEEMVKKHSMSNLGLSLYGYVDVAYTRNFNNPSDDTNQNRIFDVDSNSFRVSLAQIVLEKVAKTGGPLEDAAGFRAKLNFGEDAQFTGGTFAGDDIDFQEVYAQFIAPVGNGIDLRMGRMNTLIGYEVIESPYNLNYSRSWLFGFGQPFTTTGFRASYDFTEEVSFAIGVINDFKGSISDDNNTKGVESALSYSPTDWLGLTAYGYFSSNEGAIGSEAGRLLGGGIIDIQATESTAIILEGYYANQPNASDVPGSGVPPGKNARWNGFAGYIVHDFSEQWGLRFRGEIFEDASGFVSCFGTGTSGGKPGTCAPGKGTNGQTLWETTYTLQYKPVPSLMTRLEYRYDKSDQKTFLKGTKAVDNQQTFAVEVIYLF